MAVTRKTLEKRLTEIGYGALSDDDLYKVDAYGYWEFALYSPPGMMFYATRCHSLCGSADTKTEAYAEILADIEGKGLVPCDQEECDGCERYTEQTA